MLVQFMLCCLLGHYFLQPENRNGHTYYYCVDAFVLAARSNGRSSSSSCRRQRRAWCSTAYTATAATAAFRGPFRTALQNQPATVAAATRAIVVIAAEEEEDSDSVYGSGGNAGLRRITDDNKDNDAASPRLWLESQKVAGAYTVLRCDYNGYNTGGLWKIWGRDFHLQRLRESFSAILHLPKSNKGIPTTASTVDPLALDEASRQTVEVIDKLLSSAPHEFDELKLLLDTTEKRNSTNHHQNKKGTFPSVVVMVTILWSNHDHRVTAATTTTANNNGPTTNQMIRVQGHACVGDTTTFTSGSGITTSTADDDDNNCLSSSYDPQPLTAVVAMPACCDATTHPQQIPIQHINRQPYPHAKLSAWCSERRPLEKRYYSNMPGSVVEIVQVAKDEGTDSGEALVPVTVNEVILTEYNDDDAMNTSTAKTSSNVRLLEGLTSNLFVVYPNNVIRTAGDGVLPGYARHLVMEAVGRGIDVDDSADSCCWTMDTTTPIRLDEVGQWQHVFCTSAIRLIVPLGRILVEASTRPAEVAASVDNGSNNDSSQVAEHVVLQEVWRSGNTPLLLQRQPLLWKLLYDSILNAQYGA